MLFQEKELSYFLAEAAVTICTACHVLSLSPLHMHKEEKIRFHQEKKARKLSILEKDRRCLYI